MVASMIDVSEIANKQVEWTKNWHIEDKDPEGLEGVWKFIHGNHRCNYNLWHEEDCARREDMGFEFVYNAKRAIDGYNQRRNDFIERVDQFLFESLQPNIENSPINSETPGMIMDRMSIMALKHYHMVEQTERDEVSEEHRQASLKKVQVLEQQRGDLIAILQQFLEEIASGKRAFKVYFQFKMYNDPTLNPQLYNK